MAVETAANIARGVGTLSQAMAAGTVLTANATINATTGVNVIGSTMIFNPIHSLAIGSTMGIFSSDKYAFRGAFGYKSLLRGIDAPRDYLTLGGVTLPMLQAGARVSMAMGLPKSSLFVQGMANVTEYGLGNVIGSSFLNLSGLAEANGIAADELAELLSERFDMQGSSRYAGDIVNTSTRSEYIDLMRSKKGPIISGPNHRMVDGTSAKYGAHYDVIKKARSGRMARTMAWLSGKNIDEALGNLSKVTHGGDTVGYMMNTSKLKGLAAITKGSRMAAGLRTLGLVDIMALGGAAALWAGGQVLEGASQAFAFGLDKAMDIQRLDFGTGQLAPAFHAPGAATERQRAARAIYSAKINPSQRAFGNEARNLHR
jgi:hypothetical protein